jgi:hypothetical protein
LLESTSGKPIEHIQLRERLGNEPAGDDKVNLLVVDCWYKEKRPLLSAGFSKAILTCLQEYLNPDASFDNSKYCSVMKENILQPLEDEDAASSLRCSTMNGHIILANVNYGFTNCSIAGSSERI